MSEEKEILVENNKTQSDAGENAAADFSSENSADSAKEPACAFPKNVGTRVLYCPAKKKKQTKYLKKTFWWTPKTFL